MSWWQWMAPPTTPAARHGQESPLILGGLTVWRVQGTQCKAGCPVLSAYAGFSTTYQVFSLALLLVPHPSQHHSMFELCSGETGHGQAVTELIVRQRKQMYIGMPYHEHWLFVIRV
jgi:hypothetical protein